MLCPHRADTFGEDYVAEEHGTDIQETDYKNHISQPVAVSSLVVRGTVGYSAVIAKNVRNPTKLCGCLCDQLTECEILGGLVNGLSSKHARRRSESGKSAHFTCTLMPGIF
jgi:hypothetical protein